MNEEGLGGPEGGPLSWRDAWFRALTKPSVATFEELAAPGQITTQRAYTWVFFASLATQAIMLMGSWLTGISMYDALAGGAGVTIVSAIVCAPIAALGLALFAIMIAVLQWLAGLLGGCGRYDDLVPAVASFQAPLAILSGIFAAAGSRDTVAACLSVPVMLYGIVLQVMAVKAVNRFDWGRAIATVLIPAAPVLLACVGIAVWIAVNGVPFIGI